MYILQGACRKPRQLFSGQRLFCGSTRRRYGVLTIGVKLTVWVRAEPEVPAAAPAVVPEPVMLKFTDTVAGVYSVVVSCPVSSSVLLIESHGFPSRKRRIERGKDVVYK